MFVFTLTTKQGNPWEYLLHSTEVGEQEAMHPALLEASVSGWEPGYPGSQIGSFLIRK